MVSSVNIADISSSQFLHHFLFVSPIILLCIHNSWIAKTDSPLRTGPTLSNTPKILRLDFTWKVAKIIFLVKLWKVGLVSNILKMHMPSEWSYYKDVLLHYRMYCFVLSSEWIRWLHAVSSRSSTANIPYLTAAFASEWNKDLNIWNIYMIFGKEVMNILCRNAGIRYCQ